MQSPEHEKEKARARIIKPENEEAVNKKKRQMELKMQMNSLRHQLREMTRDNAAKTDPQTWQALLKHLQDLPYLVLGDGACRLAFEALFCDFGFNGKILELLGKPTKLKHILQCLFSSNAGVAMTSYSKHTMQISGQQKLVG